MWYAERRGLRWRTTLRGMGEPEEMLTITQVATELGYSRKHIYTLIERGHLKPKRDPFKRRDSMLIPRSQVEEIKRQRGDS